MADIVVKEIKLTPGQLVQLTPLRVRINTLIEAYCADVQLGEGERVTLSPSGMSLIVMKAVGSDQSAPAGTE